MQKTFQRILTNLVLVSRNKSGQDMIEYALLAAFLTVAVAAFFPTNIAPNISTVFSKITSVLNKA